MLQRLLIAMCLVTWLATAVNAQSPRRGEFRGFFSGQGRLLIDLEEIRKELHIDDQQVGLLDALQEDLDEQRLAIREEDEGPRTADETVERIRFEQLIQKLSAFDRRSETLVKIVLEPNQANRLSELYLQRDGIRAFERPEIASKLELSDEQKQRLQALRETFVENRPFNQRELRDKEEAALRELLSEQQQTLWQQLLGKPFNFPAMSRPGLRNR